MVVGHQYKRETRQALRLLGSEQQFKESVKVTYLVKVLHRSAKTVGLLAHSAAQQWAQLMVSRKRASRYRSSSHHQGSLKSSAKVYYYS